MGEGNNQKDLLNAKKKLEIKETVNQGVFVKDCILRMARSPKDLLVALKDGVKARAVGDTQMNRESSRSHCIFTVFIEMEEKLKVKDCVFNAYL